jgi:hypothetical protein
MRLRAFALVLALALPVATASSPASALREVGPRFALTQGGAIAGVGGRF